MVKLEEEPAPPRSWQDEKFRLSTFSGLRTQVYAAEEFARGGFYCEGGNVVVCYSCLLQHSIDDIVGSNPSHLQWHDHRCRHALRLRSYPPRGSNIDIVDEVCSDFVGDPPGQRSFYIPPGDLGMEQYRLSTFEHYPTLPGFLALPSFRRGLAKNGFYFTGFTDRVKCFSCGRSVDKWKESDQTDDQKWHRRTCSLKNGLQCDNVPIRFCFGDLLNTIAGHDTVLQQRNHNTGDIRTVRFPQVLPDGVRQNGGSFNIGPGNEVQIQGGPVAQPQGENEDQPRRKITSNQNSSGGQAPQPRGVPEPLRGVPTWRMAAVTSQDHRRFLKNLYLNRELDRITSYARWPSDLPNVRPAALAKTGFYYLGDMERVQCFSCGGVLRNWSLDDNAEREHRAHFGGCHMVLGNEPSNLPIPTHPESSQLLAVNYPLRFPQNPHMRGQAQREQTFDRRWPTRALRVNVEEVAEAGFFYLGERDRVQCFYCNGGLQNWEFDDKPWDEHAKWFPNCQFLLRTKGQKFVSYHLAPDAQLARSIIARQDGSPLDRIGRQPTPPLTVIDPQAEMRERKERVKNIMRNSEVVKNVLTMGFSEQIVEKLLIDRIVSNKEDNPDDIYGTVSELLDDVMKTEDEIRQEEEERRDQTQSILSNPSGGAFQIGPVTIVSTQRAQPANQAWIMTNVISSDHRRTNLFLNRKIDGGIPGYFYLGDMDGTQCFPCGGVLSNWSQQDEAAAQHNIHYAGQLAVDPLRFPQNPHIRGQAQREAAFDRRGPAGGSFNEGSLNGVQIQNGPGARPQASEVVIRQMATGASLDHRTFSTDLDLDFNRELDSQDGSNNWI